MTTARARSAHAATSRIGGRAVGAVCAQGSQALASLALQVLAARALGIEGLGAFALLYGVIVFLTGFSTGFVGDSLTVLDRGARRVRSALQGWALIIAVGSASAAAVVLAATGFVSATDAALFAVAAVVFLLEDVIRRTLMAVMRFWKIVATDLTSLAVSVLVLGVIAGMRPLTLGDFLAALALGQFAALAAGAALLPRSERRLVALVGGGYAAVARYGVWRAAQQAVRPGLLAATRTLVFAVIGLAATGQLEAARIYASPTLLFIGGLSSFLFASFALAKEEDLRALRRRADTGVVALFAATILIGGVSILLIPWIGALVTGHALDLPTVIAWMIYAGSVAAVTPYGALAAVRGRQVGVFVVRLSDSLVSLALAALSLWAGGALWTVPIALAVGSIAGGAVIRLVLLRTTAPPRRVDAPEPALVSQGRLGASS
ncbi:hypothetical protein [Leifsonia sp. NPDC080035]|uniref:Polysaccharide biosynthesis protein C-terminal domain-containing protein n=1 Tax=Leifsonia sp. NPDC080035 TaxID=3143936 RepID=A0AAU7GGL1_9MICO